MFSYFNFKFKCPFTIGRKYEFISFIPLGARPKQIKLSVLTLSVGGMLRLTRMKGQIDVLLQIECELEILDNLIRFTYLLNITKPCCQS